MGDEYQLRKDIDRIYDSIWNNELDKFDLTRVEDFTALLDKLGFNKSNNDRFNFAIINKTLNGVNYIEYWILANAYYNYDAKRFVKINEASNSFGIQIQSEGTYPNEQELGYIDNTSIGVWRNPSWTIANQYRSDDYDYTDYDTKSYIGARRRSDDKWIEYGIFAGWNNSFMIDSYGGMTIGGAGFEIDGNGIFPYTRLTSSQYTDSSDNTYALFGLLDNAYHPTLSGWECDSNTTYSWFVGLRTEVSDNVKDNTSTQFVVMYNDTSSQSDSHTLDVSNWHIVFAVGTGGVVDLS